MRLAQVVPSLADRHGGPSKSVRALAGALARTGNEVELLTTSEAGESPPDAGPDDASIRVFPRMSPHRLCRSPRLAEHLRANTYDCIHSHALWLLTLRYAHRAASRSGTPLVISPRGMMSSWAWNHHRTRKWFAAAFVHPSAFAGASGWHATSADEAADIRRLGFRQPVCIAPNGVVLPEKSELESAAASWRALCPGLRGRRVALFYSRFHRKKRLRELIDLWMTRPRADWILLIAGVPEEYTPEEVRSWVNSRGGGESVLVHDGRNHPPPYALASLFLLPSHSENFGLVIAEALASGVPALVTDGTPWQGLSDTGTGACVPWNGYGAALEHFLASPPESLREQGQRGRAWMARDFSWEKAAALLADFYRSLVKGR